MISYKLALNLKEAGFPQDKVRIDGRQTFRMAKFDSEGFEEEVVISDLDNLIEACGDDFNGIVKVMKKFYPEQSEWWWEAVSKKGYKYGDTPEESVANLWLFLNKKQCLK